MALNSASWGSQCVIVEIVHHIIVCNVLCADLKWHKHLECIIVVAVYIARKCLMARSAARVIVAQLGMRLRFAM